MYARKRFEQSPLISRPFHFGTQPLLELPSPQPSFSRQLIGLREPSSYQFRTKFVPTLYQIVLALSPAASISSTSLPKNTPGIYTPVFTAVSPRVPLRDSRNGNSQRA